MICEKCGEPIAQDALYCENCGARAALQADAAQARSASARKSMPLDEGGSPEQENPSDTPETFYRVQTGLFRIRQNADRIYRVRTNDEYTEGKISTRVPYSLAAYLTQHFPKIAVAAPFHLISERIRFYIR